MKQYFPRQSTPNPQNRQIVDSNTRVYFGVRLLDMQNKVIQGPRKEEKELKRVQYHESGRDESDFADDALSSAAS
jgi:hypothetical protein